MRIVLLAALMILGLALAGSTGSSATPAMNGLSKTENYTSIVQPAYCRAWRRCWIDRYGYRHCRWFRRCW